MESLNSNFGKMRLFKIVILPSKVRPLDFQRFKMVCNVGQYPSKFNRKSSHLSSFGLTGMVKPRYCIVLSGHCKVQTKVRQRLFLPMFASSYIKGFRFIPVNGAARKHTEFGKDSKKLF